jgi:hypothetical protein
MGPGPSADTSAFLFRPSFGLCTSFLLAGVIRSHFRGRVSEPMSFALLRSAALVFLRRAFSDPLYIVEDNFGLFVFIMICKLVLRAEATSGFDSHNGRFALASTYQRRSFLSLHGFGRIERWGFDATTLLQVAQSISV